MLILDLLFLKYEGGIVKLTPGKKTTLKKASLIRVNVDVRICIYTNLEEVSHVLYLNKNYVLDIYIYLLLYL